MSGRTAKRREQLEFRLLAGAEVLRASASTVSAGDRTKEFAAFDAGGRIKAGELALRHLVTIANWKSPRSKSRIAKNTKEDVQDALGLCLAALTDRAAISVLIGLRGVQVPMASAILTALDQERHTVIDVRALASLGVNDRAPTIQDYCEYVEFCRREANRLGMTLRDFDLAIWGLGKQFMERK